MTDNDAATAAVVAPVEVLDFWFGGAFGDEEAMADPGLMPRMMPLWFGATFGPKGPVPVDPEKSAELDCSCLKFVNTIRALQRGEFEGKPEWETTDGLFAQIILADQLARNCFRGTAEAFAFAPQAKAAARKIFKGGLFKEWKTSAYFTFLLCVGEHSEDAADHAMNKELLAFVRDRFPDDASIDQLAAQVVQHTEVFERFGRYPHRNAALGRESTAEEEAWLADVDNLPGWAKSQQVNRRRQ